MVVVEQERKRKSCFDFGKKKKKKLEDQSEVEGTLMRGARALALY